MCFPIATTNGSLELTSSDCLTPSDPFKQAASTGTPTIPFEEPCFRSGNGRSVLGITDLLNSDESSRSLDELKLVSKSPVLLVDSLLMPKPSFHRITKLKRSKVHPTLLKPTLLVDIAIRRKSTTKKGSEQSSSKLHLKLLEAGLRIRLISCPSIYELYRQLTPHNARKNSLVSIYFSEMSQSLAYLDILRVLKAHRGHRINYPSTPQLMDGLSTPRSSTSEDRSDGLVTPEGVTEEHPYLLYSGKCQSKRVRLIDSNLVNISRISNKVLKTFVENNPLLDHASPDSSGNTIVTTFNQLDTAVTSLFDIQEYSLVRVTRSASSSSNGSVLMKLETAKRGDFSLIDDREFMDDMLASLGKPGQRPNNIFIKKVVARPRYKSDMKIYIIPSTEDILLYADERIFERDLINGVIDMDTPPLRKIFTTFFPENVLSRVRNLLDKSKDMHDMHSEPVDNHIFGDISLDRHGLVDESATSVTDSMLSSSLLPSMTSSSLVSSDNSSLATPSYGDILFIPNAKNKSEEYAAPLKFDTDYAA